MKSMSKQFIRHPAGQPIGGQFATHMRTDPEILLHAFDPADVMTQLSVRRRTLREAGYIPAGSGPQTTTGIDDWWETHYNRAEIAPTDSYHLMPDDYTPSMTHGKSLTEHRRTHRMLYRGAGVALRMPSATSIKRFSDEIGHDTFDLPIEAEYPGGTISGYVRVTRNGPSEWAVSGVNLPEPANSYTAEAVSAVLEGRRPRMALASTQNLLARRQARLAAAGVAVKPIEHSEWIRGIGYNTAQQQMVIQLGDRTYGYHVAHDVFEAARDSWSPGQIYNRLIKGKTRFELGHHDVCGRYFNAQNPHRCPSRHHDRNGLVKLYNARVSEHVAGRA